ncbi:MAG: MFS transporter [Clostridia bacterium]|nr:MFS transporter [Clostridia bacterium]
MVSAAELKDKLSDVRVYWNKPLKGRYMPFKEIAAYSVGGIGVYFIKMIATTIIISATNVVLSNVTGIPPRHLLLIQYLITITGIPLTAVKAHMIDGMRLKSGKYKPWILGMGIPTVALCLLVVFTPYKQMSTAWVYILTILYSIALNFTYWFFEEAYENLIFLLSPNTQERADVSAIKSITYSLAPTIYMPLIPLMVKLMHANDMYDIRIYQVLFPIISVIGVGMSILVFANTNEKLVQAKTHVVQIGFFDAIKAVAKNKYFWIISLATWIGFLEGAMGYILAWLYNYGKLCTDEQYAFITLIYGNASLWGMIAAPFCIKRWGKKRTMIVTNLFNILFIACLYPAVSLHVNFPDLCIWIVLVFLWLNALMNSFAVILNPAVQADIRDYQHYITGERIDGMFAAVGLITSFITMATNSVIPLIFDRYGINEHNGYENAFDILGREPETLYALINLLIVLSIFGAAMNVIPYFFYDLSEEKQRGMIGILKIRAMFEDFGNDALTDRDLIDGTDLLHDALAAEETPLQDVAPNLTRKERRATETANSDLRVHKMIAAEYRKFDTEEFRWRSANAVELLQGGLTRILSADRQAVVDAKALPADTESAKAIRKFAVTQARQLLGSKKTVEKHYNGQMPEFDDRIFETLFTEETENDNAKTEAYRKLDAAKAAKNKAEIAEIRAELKALKDDAYRIKGAIKEATRENSRYNRAIRPYAEAQKLLTQKENYTRFSEIEARYDAAVAREAEAEAAAKALAEQEAEERRRDKERRLEERKNRK